MNKFIIFFQKLKFQIRPENKTKANPEINVHYKLKKTIYQKKDNIKAEKTSQRSTDTRI